MMRCGHDALVVCFAFRMIGRLECVVFIVNAFSHIHIVQNFSEVVKAVFPFLADTKLENIVIGGGLRRPSAAPHPP